jgi:DNA-binding MarR family transcriptional regulator
MKNNQTAEREAELRQVAQELERHLAAIRQEIRRPVEAEFAKGGLTGPQRNAMQALMKSDGQSLSELTAQLGLAHSTVSGIVDRLEKRGMVKRQTNPKDRRNTRIMVSKEVRDFMEQQYPVLAASPLLDALRAAEEGEREAMVRGVRALRQLLVDRSATRKPS